jgi:hypothetical protein
MGESAETTLLQSSGLPNPDALYCEGCLQVDKFFSNTPNAMSRRQTWDLRLSSGNIKKDTTCPSCKDLLHIETRGFNAEDIEMRCGFKHIWVSPRDLPQNPYLLQRSEYSLRLQNNPLASTQAVHLPIKMIKAWLKICELSHKGCDANETAMSLYLIDVIAECIKFVPIARRNYVALSYVWGNVE